MLPKKACNTDFTCFFRNKKLIVWYTTTANMEACKKHGIRDNKQKEAAHQTRAKAMRGNEGRHRKSWPSPRYRQDRTLGRWWAAHTRVLVLVTQRQVGMACANNWNQLSELHCWSSFFILALCMLLFLTLFPFWKASASFCQYLIWKIKQKQGLFKKTKPSKLKKGPQRKFKEGKWR